MVDSRKKRLAVYVLLLTFLSFTAYNFLNSISSPNLVEKKVFEGEFIQKGELNYLAKLKKNLVYEKETVSKGEIVYPSLLEEMTLKYQYNSSPPGISGKYVVKLYLSPLKGEWEKKILELNGNFSSTFEEIIPLDWQRFLTMWKDIENETKYDFGNPNLRILAEIELSGVVLGRKIEDRFVQSSNITYGKILTFSELEKVKREPIYRTELVVNQMNVLGFRIDAALAKIIFTPSFLITLLLFALLLYKDQSVRDYWANRERRSFERKFRRKIVDSRDFKINQAIKLKSLKDLGKISYELDKPIIRSGKAYAVIDGEKVYVYDDYNNIIDEKG